MTEVIHEHVASDTSSNTAMSFMIGVLLLIVVVFLVVYFLGSRFWGGFTNNVNTSPSTPQVNVPKKVDINVNK